MTTTKNPRVAPAFHVVGGEGGETEKAENPWRMSIRAAPPPRVRALFAPLLLALVLLLLLLQHGEVISHFDAHQHAFFSTCGQGRCGGAGGIFC